MPSCATSTIAATLLAAGPIDEVRLLVNPGVLGGGLPFFPSVADRIELRPLETRAFSPDVVLLRYEVSPTR